MALRSISYTLRLKVAKSKRKITKSCKEAIEIVGLKENGNRALFLWTYETGAPGACALTYHNFACKMPLCSLKSFPILLWKVPLHFQWCQKVMVDTYGGPMQCLSTASEWDIFTRGAKKGVGANWINTLKFLYQSFHELISFTILRSNKPPSWYESNYYSTRRQSKSQK